MNEHLEKKRDTISNLGSRLKVKGACHSYCFIQKQSIWKTRIGQLRSRIPSRKPETVSLEYEVKKEVESHRPNDQLGRILEDRAQYSDPTTSKGSIRTQVVRSSVYIYQGSK